MIMPCAQGALLAIHFPALFNRLFTWFMGFKACNRHGLGLSGYIFETNTIDNISYNS